MKNTNTTVGILAHVDAGKTTLAEGLLYRAGAIRKAGRVDHRDAFLDTDAMEKDRGITIFSKQAQLNANGRPFTLLDTPGHADFSAETERTLQVLDYALLVISGADGIQGQVLTLWKLLEQYRIPVFIFVNKMDQDGTDQSRLLAELKRSLDSNCIAFPEEPDDAFFEDAAACEETLLNRYLETGTLRDEEIRGAIRKRFIFPCYFGSALRMEGVGELLDGLARWTQPADYPAVFGARVYKISREDGQRLTWMKITGGSLAVKQTLNPDAEHPEKADQIRLYSGNGYQLLKEAPAGCICAVTGLSESYAGEGIGFEEDRKHPVLSPVLSYAIRLPEGTDVHQAYRQLKQLDEEIPELRLDWDEHASAIRAGVMGEVQIEILTRLIRERFGMEAAFEAGKIVYKETIADKVEGVGHFEPLRHYAEVHLILEPLPAGSGLVFDTICSADDLALNWQRLILTHLAERRHKGVLTGSELTDMKITLAAGRAHPKHTEGGDFRQATYRAVRQGLMQAKSVLLEPVYSFRLEVPPDQIGRAMSDIGGMHGTFGSPASESGRSVLCGSVPAACIQNYPAVLRAYTGGQGQLSLTLKGYEPCHNAEEIIEASGYDPDADPDYPSGSVFCSHGAGIFVPWNQIGAHMHLESVWKKESPEAEAHSGRESSAGSPGGSSGGKKFSYDAGIEEEKELMEIFAQTYRKGQDRGSWNRRKRPSSSVPSRAKSEQPRRRVLLVDGYNIIFSWDELRDLARSSLDAARGKLLDILSNYQAFHNLLVIVVFDAYKISGGEEKTFRYQNLFVIYTREAETADTCIQRAAHDIAGNFDVTVATSDLAEQVVIWGAGAGRMSARDLHEEIQTACREIQEQYLQRRAGGKRYLFENLSEDLSGLLEEMRLGKDGNAERGKEDKI